MHAAAAPANALQEVSLDNRAVFENQQLRLVDERSIPAGPGTELAAPTRRRRCFAVWAPMYQYTGL